MPLAVPLHDVSGAVIGQARGDDLQCLAVGCHDLVESRFHIENGIDRGLETTGNLAVDIGDGLEILVVTAAFALAVHHSGDLGKRHHPAVPAVYCELQEIVHVRSL